MGEAPEPAGLERLDLGRPPMLEFMERREIGQTPLSQMWEEGNPTGDLAATEDRR